MGLILVYAIALYAIIAFVHGAQGGNREDVNEESARPPLWWIAIHTLGSWLALQPKLFPERWCEFVCRFKMLRGSLCRRMTEVVRRGWHLIGANIE